VTIALKANGPALMPGLRIAYHRTVPGASIGDRETGRAPAPAGGLVMGREKLSPEERLREKAAAFKLFAEELPYGREREDLLLRARRLETASHIGKWISSPGLSPPT
jgi:hypothetical protein